MSDTAHPFSLPSRIRLLTSIGSWRLETESDKNLRVEGQGELLIGVPMQLLSLFLAADSQLLALGFGASRLG